MTMIVETSDGMRLDRGSIPLISICLKKARVIDARVFFCGIFIFQNERILQYMQR